MNTKSAMMQFKSRKKESGQALVLIAMLIVILLGFLGLAIDGGGMFLLWRDAQNAVDAAALQAAFAYCTNGENIVSAQEAGERAALMNGFNGLDDNTVTVDRAVNLVSTSELPGNATVLNDIIMVRIEAEKPAYFIQLVYGGPLRVEVDALGVCNAGGDNFFEDYAVYAMGSEGICGDSYQESDFTGSGSHFYSNVGSNADIRVQGSTGGATFHDGAGVTFVDEIDGSSKWVTDPNTGPVSGSDTPVAEQPYSSFPVLYTWEQFQPGTGEIWNAIDALNGTMGDWASDPNLHYSSTGMNLENADMMGLYVIDGDVKAWKDFSVHANGITIVLSGEFTVAGSINNKNNPNLWHPFTTSAGVTNSLFVFSSNNPSGNVPPTSCPTGGGNAAISFSGSGIVAEGIIYAPYSLVEWSSSESYYCGAIVSLAFTTSNSDKFFFSEEIPSDAVLAADGAAQWFLDLPFEGRNCDFFNSTSSNIFLGDLGD